MTGQPSSDIRRTQRLTFARTSCLCLGVALILWSLAPAVVERILTGAAPPLRTFVLGSVTFLIGITFVGLQRCIRLGLRWALWTAFGLALAIATAGVGAMLTISASTPALFSLIFAGATVAGTWLGLAEKPAPAPRATSLRR